MKTETITVVNIEWEVIKFNGINFDEFIEYHNNHDYGFYQVYGHHPAYGDDALLYIGITENSFASRLNNRWEFYESTARPSAICIGRIVQPKSNDEQLQWSKEELDKIIPLCEKLLLKTHTPAFNAQYVKGLESTTEKNILIINWGEYKRLLPEISSLRMSFRYWEYENPVGME